MPRDSKSLLNQLITRQPAPRPLLPSLLKFALQQMLGPAVPQPATAPALAPPTGQLGPVTPRPAQPKVKTLGGNTPSLNPIGLMGGISTVPGKITGNAAFAGPKVKPL